MYLSSGFNGYGYFQTTTTTQTAAAGSTQANGVPPNILQQQQPGEAQLNGSTYFEYQSQQPSSAQAAAADFPNIRDSSGFGRNAEVLTNQLTSHITPCSTSPAVVAQALSGMQDEDSYYY